MNVAKNVKIIENCIGCENCIEVCDTYKVTQDILKSPHERLRIAKNVFMENEISREELNAIYTCTLCGACDLVCSSGIIISEIILDAKKSLVKSRKAPLEIHKKIIKGIVEQKNSVNGNRKNRLNWLVEIDREFEKDNRKDSPTLLFLGCMSSFRVMESAKSAYQLLKKAFYDFKVFSDEPCCGEYVYSAGDEVLAKKIFQENFQRFKHEGIEEILTTCGGCLYAFNNAYPKYIKEWDIKVKHIIQVVYDLFKEKKIRFKKSPEKITYHDPCRLGRKLHDLEIYDEPRELLTHSSLGLFEFSNSKRETNCCGAGAGVRGVESSIAISIGTQLLKEAKTDKLISSCPLCVFNYRYANYKSNLNKEVEYITTYLLENLDV